MQPLTLSLIQTATRWHDPAANRQLFEAWLTQVPADTDLVVLPEMFSTGFTMASADIAEDTAEDGESPTLAWLGEQARLHDKTLCGSMVVAEQGRYFNRFVWMPPCGSRVFYDKRHRFRMAGEHLHYAAGSRRVIVECNGWRILPLVCYDLRFPVWLRNRRQGDARKYDNNYDLDYDLLLCVANWPAARRIAWQTLLRARAIENLCYAAGVNVVGTDGNGVAYSGDSGAYGPEGQQLLDAGSGSGVFTATLDGAALSAYRDRFPAWQDADEFELKE